MRSILTLHHLLRGAIATRGRVAALAALGLVGAVIGLAVGLSDTDDHRTAATQFVNSYGLSLFTPVATLIFAAAALGDPVEDGTLVYLWARPVARWQLALAALTATLSVSLPIVLIPMSAAAALSGGGLPVVLGTIASCAVGVVAYGAIFVLLGLRTRRALMWGLAYVLLWEGFVASAGANAARLAVRAYTRSILARIADVEVKLGTMSPAVAVLVPLTVAVVAFVLTVRRLRRIEVA